MIFKPIIKKKIKTPLSLKQYYENRNKVLIKRRAGGFGDVLMQRMMFEDFHKQFPQLEFTFSCPQKFIDCAKNHPFIQAIELEKIQDDDFGAIYDISTACRTHELRYGIHNQKHRSDIWAEHCGVNLCNHNQFLTVDQNLVMKCQELLKNYNTKNLPIVLITTKSVNDAFGNAKSLTDTQVINLVQNLREMGFYVFTIHSEMQDVYSELQIDQFVNIKLNQWLAMVSAANYVISVDTATFHMAGGLKKPLLGIFSFTDGKVVGKYYDFVLVQKHKDDGNWDCGPCWCLHTCPKSSDPQKPCIADLTTHEIIEKFKLLFL